MVEDGLALFAVVGISSCQLLLSNLHSVKGQHEDIEIEILLVTAVLHHHWQSLQRHLMARFGFAGDVGEVGSKVHSLGKIFIGRHFIRPLNKS